MRNAYAIKIHAALERALPEQRLFLRTDSETRFIRLSSATQFVALSGTALVLGWTIISSAILLMHSLGAGDLKEQALRDQAVYGDRLNQLAAERDARADEAAKAQARFGTALAEVSAMQSRLLASEDRLKELETGIDVIAATLRDTMQERDAARDETAALEARLAENEAEEPDTMRLADLEKTLDVMTLTLQDLAGQRDAMQGTVEQAELTLDRISLDSRPALTARW